MRGFCTFMSSSNRARGTDILLVLDSESSKLHHRRPLSDVVKFWTHLGGRALVIGCADGSGLEAPHALVTINP